MSAVIYARYSSRPGFQHMIKGRSKNMVTRGHTKNALKCKYIGGIPTLGCTIVSERHYQIGPYTAPIVPEMFIRYNNSSTVQEIQDYLMVPQDLFDRVQEKMGKNKKVPAQHKAEDDGRLSADNKAVLRNVRSHNGR